MIVVSPTALIQALASLLGLASVITAKRGSWKWAAPLLIVSHSILLAYFGVTGQQTLWIFNVGMIGAAIWNWMDWRKRMRMVQEAASVKPVKVEEIHQ